MGLPSVDVLDGGENNVYYGSCMYKVLFGIEIAKGLGIWDLGLGFGIGIWDSGGTGKAGFVITGHLTCDMGHLKNDL